VARPIPRGKANLRASMGIEPVLAERSPIIFLVMCVSVVVRRVGGEWASE